MLISVVPIGNSKGIRIPKSILQQLDIHEKVELEVFNKEIHIKPVNELPRAGWKELFMEMHEQNEDTLLISNEIEQDNLEWEW